MTLIKEKVTLLELRQREDYSLAKVRDLCGVEPAALSRIERGLSTPTFDTLVRLLDLYDVEFEAIDWLVNENEANKKDSCK